DEQTEYLCRRYKSHRLNTNRLTADYLYLTEDLAGFAGRKYSAQRNHIKHFVKDFPNAAFRHLMPGDCEKVSAFFAEFESAFTKQSDFAKKELAYAKDYMLSECECPTLSCCVELDGRIIAVCAGERFGDCIDVQIEKCLPGFNGCYPFVVNEFAKVCLGKAKYMNREDDAADAGLRTSKTQYHPIRLIPNSDFEVTGELVEFAHSSPDFLRETGNLISAPVSVAGDANGTHILSLTHILDSDSDDYDRLCLDDNHNRLWGYDYKKDIPNPTPGCFLEAARKAFAEGAALSLAIRLDGRFIGEAVYFVVDGRGSAKLGWRLLPEFCGKGLAALGFKMAGDFGLYEIGFGKLKAYCYRENEPSAKSIAHSMKQVGEDEKFFYFERTI
ncbi:MAG: GNAT family N-acetyltransferase, partial [Firmicutes bacterium]|nr:GNAT family N-acetyltransferase [Bacillota bacterium]